MARGPRQKEGSPLGLPKGRREEKAKVVTKARAKIPTEEKEEKERKRREEDGIKRNDVEYRRERIFAKV